MVKLDAGYAYVGRDGKVIARSRAKTPPVLADRFDCPQISRIVFATVYWMTSA